MKISPELLLFMGEILQEMLCQNKADPLRSFNAHAEHCVFYNTNVGIPTNVNEGEKCLTEVRQGKCTFCSNQAFPFSKSFT